MDLMKIFEEELMRRENWYRNKNIKIHLFKKILKL